MVAKEAIVILFCFIPLVIPVNRGDPAEPLVTSAWVGDQKSACRNLDKVPHVHQGLVRAGIVCSDHGCVQLVTLYLCRPVLCFLVRETAAAYGCKKKRS